MTDTPRDAPLTALHSRDAEQSVLGAMLISPEAVALVREILSPDEHFDPRHVVIHEAILALDARGAGVDPVTVHAALERKGQSEKSGGLAYLNRLFQQAPNEGHAEEYARIVADSALLRRIVRAGEDIARLAHTPEGTAREKADQAESLVYGLSERAGRASTISDIATIAEGVMVAAEHRALGSGSVARLATGIPALDDYMGGGLVAPDYTVIAGRASMGKCHGINTPLLMFDGTVKMVQDVCVGDELMGPDSRARTVVSLARGIDDMYRVVPKKGAEYVVNSEHILSLRMNIACGGHKKGEVVNLSIQQYLAASERFRRHAKGWRVGVDFSFEPTLIDPYFLGVWLGDGSSEQPSVTTSDPEIKDYVAKIAKSYDLELHEMPGTELNKSTTWLITSGKRKLKPCKGCNHLLTAMQQEDLIKNKHIPKSYLINSREVRLKVLAGLIDTDGYAAGAGVRATFKSRRLAEDVVFLARSLGYAAYMKPCYKSAHAGHVGLYYRLNISGEVSEIPTLLARKKPTAYTSQKNVLNVGVLVEPIGIGEYYGFMLSGDGLYLLGDFTVTHNTAVLAAISLSVCIEQRHPAIMFSMEMTREQFYLRLACALAGVNTRHLQDGLLEPEERVAVKDFNSKLKDAPLYVDEASSITPGYIRSTIRRVSRKHGGLALIGLDYLQLMRSDTVKAGFSRVAELADISTSVKTVARDLKIPIVALAQINRSVESRDNKRPTMSDIKDCGRIEEDADQVIGLYRESYYAEIGTLEQDMEKRVDEVELLFLKYRNGPTGMVKTGFKPKYTRFVPLQDDLDKTCGTPF